MKTKLFSFFIAVFLFSIGSKAQTTTTCPSGWAYPHCISLIGPGTPGGDWATDTYLSTTDGDVYTKLDVQFSVGEVKFRQDGCWDGCAGNPAGWGPALSSESGWPSGTNTAPVPFGPNIQCPGGVWNVKFTLSTQSWEFTPGTPNAVVKLVGTGVTDSPITMTTKDGENYTIKLAKLNNASCQFEVDGVLGGSTAFPNGSALSPTELIPVTTTGIDYDVTFKLSTYEYTFAVATFPEIGLIGSGTTGTDAGWNADIAKMVTTDGVTYTLKNQQLYSVNSSDATAAKVKFRTYGAWTQDWGGVSFPTGPIAGNNGDIVVTADGVYDITFNKTTGAYAFSFPEIGLIGSGTTGTDAGWNADIAKMATSNGVNYTLTQQLYSVNSSDATAAKVKFRTFGAWSQDWGGVSFPTGPIAGNNGDIVVTAAGTYAINFNRLTGAYDFGTALAVNKFDAGSFKAYPNPTKNSWNITSIDDITSVQVFDILGKSVYAKKASSKEVSVNAAELSKGVYFAKISTAKGTSTVKLVKE